MSSIDRRHPPVTAMGHSGMLRAPAPGDFPEPGAGEEQRAKPENYFGTAVIKVGPFPAYSDEDAETTFRNLLDATDLDLLHVDSVSVSAESLAERAHREDEDPASRPVTFTVD